MKSAEEWREQLRFTLDCDGEFRAESTDYVIHLIQADAIRHAADMMYEYGSVTRVLKEAERIEKGET